MTKVVVEGNATTPFPLDMLRYDSCCPADEMDARVVRMSVEDKLADINGFFHVYRRQLEGAILLYRGSRNSTFTYAAALYLVTEIHEDGHVQERLEHGTPVYAHENGDLALAFAVGLEANGTLLAACVEADQRQKRKRRRIGLAT